VLGAFLASSWLLCGCLAQDPNIAQSFNKNTNNPYGVLAVFLGRYESGVPALVSWHPHWGDKQSTNKDRKFQVTIQHCCEETAR
jgi:hypothetical protein